MNKQKNAQTNVPAAFGETVYYVDDNKNRIKASVTDETARKDGAIKLTVIPADNSPFVVHAKYSEAGKTPGTWTRKPPEVEEPDESDEDEDEGTETEH